MILNLPTHTKPKLVRPSNKVVDSVEGFRLSADSTYRVGKPNARTMPMS